MNRCTREELVVAHVRSGRPDAELEAHIASCDDCASLAFVAGAVAADHRDELRRAPVAPSGLVWWRMQRRVADENARHAARAVLAAQTASFLAAIAIVVALLTVVGGDSLHALRNVMHLPSAALLAQWSVPLAACLLLAPVAVYFAFARD